MVGELSLRWSAEVPNFSTVASAIHAERGMPFEVDHMLDLIVAWEDINRCKYDTAQGKFIKLPMKSDDVSSNYHTKKKSVADLEEQVRLSEKRATRSKKGLVYPDNPFTADTVRKFKGRKSGLAQWIMAALEMVAKSLEETVADEEVSMPSTAVWDLVDKSYAKYQRKYMKGHDEGSKSRSSKNNKQRSWSRSR